MATINGVTFNMVNLRPVAVHRNSISEQPGSDTNFITDMGYDGLVLRLEGFEETLATYDSVISEFMKSGEQTLIHRTGWQFSVYSAQLTPELIAGFADNYFPYDLILYTSTPYRESSSLSCRAKAISANNQEWSAEDMPCNNLLDNWSFETWSDGASSAPDGWSSVDNPTIAREGSIIKAGTYSLKMTGTSQYSRAVQTINDYSHYTGKYVTVGCWIYSSIANSTELMVIDSVDHNEIYHPGTPGWEWITVTRFVNSAATSLEVRLYVDKTNASGVAYFDAVVLVEGESIPDNTFIRDIDTDGSVDSVPDIQITSDSTPNEVVTQTEKL